MEKNYRDGRYWTYNSIRNWQEKDFDYFSIDTVRRTFIKLEKEGFLIVSNYNKDPRDKTKWYTINDENLKEFHQDMERRKQNQAGEALTNLKS